jgi:hypothetical protein
MHKFVTIVADVMFVNGLPFLVTSSRGISLITIEFLPSRTAKRLASSIERVVRIHAKAGFVVQTSMMDMEFEKLKDLLPRITLNTTAAREHVGEIERKIRVIKERARGTISVLPYQMLPKLLIIKLMHFCLMWLISFPVKSGISEKYSPRKLVSKHKLDAELHCKSPFGSYCEIHTDPDITNTMEPRTRWAICLGPTGNLQGSYKFMSLTTGRKIVRRRFTELPITDSVIKEVAKWASKDQAMTGIKFMDKHGIEYKFNEEDGMIAEEKQIKEAPFPDIPAEAPGMLTLHKSLMSGEDIMEDEPTPQDEERAMLAAENSGIEFDHAVEARHSKVIELLGL